jgi:hypothetical protein
MNERRTGDHGRTSNDLISANCKTDKMVFDNKCGVD